CGRVVIVECVDVAQRRVLGGQLGGEACEPVGIAGRLQRSAVDQREQALVLDQRTPGGRRPLLLDDVGRIGGTRRGRVQHRVTAQDAERAGGNGVFAQRR